MLMLITEPDRWLGVELRHFAALQALASEGSFGRASERDLARERLQRGEVPQLDSQPSIRFHDLNQHYNDLR